jgi:hypothetical protein
MTLEGQSEKILREMKEQGKLYYISTKEAQPFVNEQAANLENIKEEFASRCIGPGIYDVSPRNYSRK